jgi:hypothetical protein
MLSLIGLDRVKAEGIAKANMVTTDFKMYISLTNIKRDASINAPGIYQRKLFNVKFLNIS